MANFVKTVSNNLHYGSGYISSVRSFNPPDNIGSGLDRNETNYNLYRYSGPSGYIGEYYYFNSLKYAIMSSGNVDPDIEIVDNDEVNIFSTNPNTFFASSGINIQPTQASRLSMYLKFNTEESKTTIRKRVTLYNNINSSIENTYIHDSGFPTLSTVGFRILANDTPVLTVSESYDGYINATIPAGTTEVKLETYDTAIPNLDLSNSSNIYFKEPSYDILYNDLKIYIPNVPSIPILNNTRTGNFEFVDYSDASSLSINTCTPVSGYYDVIVGQEKNGIPVDYFLVGDEYRSNEYPNLKPLSSKRNTVLKFKVPDYSYIDINGKVELIFEIEGIDTEDLEYFKSKDLNDHSIRTFFNGSFNWLSISCETSTGDFPTSVSSLSSISGINKQTTFTKGGLIIFDITSSIKQAILDNKQYINIILKYDIPTANLSKIDKYKHVSFRVGNRANNRPRLRYKLGAKLPGCDL
jgi:hypothetical protein